MTKALPHEERLAIGFAKIETDLDFLMQCFREVLVSLGEQDIADRLPWNGSDGAGPAPDDFPPRLAHAYSIAFHLLNMVEENTATQMRPDFGDSSSNNSSKLATPRTKSPRGCRGCALNPS
jgi:phosphoenolpyruvate carboxylase